MRLILLMISILFLGLLVNTVYAADIDLTDLDNQLGEALGIPAFAGGLLATMLLLVAVLGCMGAAMKRAPSAMMVVIMTIAVCSFAIMCGWFPTWTLLMIVLVIALFFGNKIIGGLK